jgi:hypothetical protein
MKKLLGFERYPENVMKNTLIGKSTTKILDGRALRRSLKDAVQHSLLPCQKGLHGEAI